MRDRENRPAPPARAAPAEREKVGQEPRHACPNNPVWQRLATSARDVCDEVLAALVRLRVTYAGAAGLDLSKSPSALDPANLLGLLLDEKFVSPHVGAESRDSAANATLARRCARAVEQRFRGLAQEQGRSQAARAPEVDAAVENLSDKVAKLFDAIDQDARLGEEFRKRRLPSKPAGCAAGRRGGG
jgi:hypothetical protein